MLGRGRSRRFSAFGFASSVLLCVGIDDRAYHGAKAFLELVTAAGVVQFHTFALTADQPRFP